MVHAIEIPGWRPALTNELMGRHPGVIARRKNRDVRVIARHAMIFGVPGPRGPRRVSLYVWGRYSTLPDPDAPLKSFQDALKRAGLIIDDSAEFLALDWPPTFRRGPRRTLIVIEDL